MIRKITLIFLLCIGIQHIAKAVVIRDSVVISMPLYTDTTCFGTQLDFFAHASSDTFTGVEFHWYANGIYTGVHIDTFHTTALNDASGDSVYCWIVFRNSSGALDSFRSNAIYIYHSASFAPGVAISLIVGSNPDCAGHLLTFIAYPINGGSAPTFQWFINHVPVAGADSNTFSHVYGSADTVSCIMISNSACATGFPTTVASNEVPIIHIRLTPLVTVAAARNPICQGAIDTFIVTIADAGAGSTLAWYVSGTIIPTALGPTYITDSLHDGNLVYCIVTTPDACVIGDSTVSNIVTMTVIPNLPDTAWTILDSGSNPGCISSRVKFSGHYINFGTAPDIKWYVNGVPWLSGSAILDTFFSDRDTVTFVVWETDHGCYFHDSVISKPILMIRDSIPPAPLVSLIGDLLVANKGGAYTWYSNTVYSYTIPTAVEMAGFITQTIHPLPYPSYYFALKDTLDCHSSPSNIIYISLLDVKNIYATPDVKIYPNPTTGILNMDWGVPVQHMRVDINNVLGQTLIHEEVNGQAHHETDMSFLPGGNYIVVFNGQDGTRSTFKVMLNK